MIEDDLTEKIIEPFFTKVMVVCSAKLLTTFYEVVVAVTSLLFFLRNGSGNIVTLKVTVAHRHWIFIKLGTKPLWKEQHQK